MGPGFFSRAGKLRPGQPPPGGVGAAAAAASAAARSCSASRFMTRSHELLPLPLGLDLL